MIWSVFSFLLRSTAGENNERFAKDVSQTWFPHLASHIRNQFILTETCAILYTTIVSLFPMIVTIYLTVCLYHNLDFIKICNVISHN